MPAPLLPIAVTTIATAEAPMAFSRDRVLASGASTAWLDAPRWAPPAHRSLPPMRAPITGFVEHG